MKLNKIFSLAAILCFTALSATQAKQVEKPSVESYSSFAVIVDEATFSACRAELMLYKQTLESEGLPTLIVADKWATPEQVREEILSLHKEYKIEGCVFVGEIPIPMVLRAQHLTTAFKMDERKHPIEECTVPSDRYYDDFDLVFERLEEHPAQGLMHFFAMSPTSPQYIECDIYSARIKPQASNGDPYKQVSAYLKKAVAEHKAKNEFDKFLSYTGHGSHSNSLVAWRSEQQVVNEQFGDRFKHNNNARFTRYTMVPYMKYDCIRELRRDDLDFMIWHQHGDYFRMYVSGDPQTSSVEEHIEQMEFRLRGQYRRSPASANKMADKWGLDSTKWHTNANEQAMIELDSVLDLKTGIILEEINDIRPNARMIFFDACFNGDFRNSDYIAGKFIFAEGKTVIGWANSVNVLQDKTSYDLMGLLGYGARVGVWAKHVNILESHIHGDPTLAFYYKDAAKYDINRNVLNNDPKYWVEQLSSEIPDIQCLAMIRLLELDYEGVSDVLLQKYMQSPYAVVRGTAMRLSERLDDANYKQILMKAWSDEYEFIRRLAVTRMGQVGDEDFIPLLIESYIKDNNSIRVMFQTTFALASFDRDKVIAAIDKRFEKATFHNAERYKTEIMRYVDTRTADNGEPSALRNFTDREDKRWRPFYIAALKNHPYHQFTDTFCKILADETEEEKIRVLMAEALAWFNISVNKEQIAATCKQLLDKGGMSEELTREVTRAYSRLTSKK
ncbi:MAG: HEAT repeat domain-containing protein [Alistipes sp.]|nr:HEAT repeat domain-containing protein [Alistipes sp.]